MWTLSGIISSNIKAYPGTLAEAMKDAEVKKQYTDEKVFLRAAVTIIDVMEDITLNITV